jgi:NAD(P)-dependent dehydrogenase (short-subunit alcohol dehydrogenase family)
MCPLSRPRRCGRDPSGADGEHTAKAAARIRDSMEDLANPRIDYVVGDATISDDMEHAVAVAQESPNGLNICVNVVGRATNAAPILLLDEKMLLAGFNINVVSALLAIKWSAPPMKAAGGGSVVCISSVAAKATSPFRSTYIASKAALESLVRVAAVELAPFGIRVNAVRPGNTATPNSSGQNATFHETDAQLIPLGRLASPSDIAAGVRYLAGPESSYVTGQSFAIDGGRECIPTTPSYEDFARRQFGDEAIDAALSGLIASGG